MCNLSLENGSATSTHQAAAFLHDFFGIRVDPTSVYCAVIRVDADVSLFFFTLSNWPFAR